VDKCACSGEELRGHGGLAPSLEIEQHNPRGARCGNGTAAGLGKELVVLHETRRPLELGWVGLGLSWKKKKKKKKNSWVSTHDKIVDKRRATKKLAAVHATPRPS
jgi:hypothetical protein